MTYRIIIEPTAERGIREAVRWISDQSSTNAAARWYNGLIKKVDTLRTHPGRCPVAPERDKFAEEIRELLYGKRRNKYRVVFTVREDQAAVHILFVHHAAKDELEP